jgi:hypothetical protein
MAAEEFATGMAVAREFVAHEGHRFLFTVTPPADRAVDPRVFDIFEVEDRAEKGVGLAAMSPTQKDSEPGDAEALDLSGYTVRIEEVRASAATSCSLSVPFVKFKKAKLSGGHYFRAVATGAAAMFVSSFGTKGDVDAAIFRGSEINGTLCSRSTKGAGQFDLAKCSEGNCNAGGEVLVGVIVNFLSADAEFVGAITVTFAQ